MENHCCFNRAQIYHSRSGWQIIAQRWRAYQTLFDGKHLRAHCWSIQHLLILFITCCQDKLQMWNVLQAERCVLWTVQSCCETPASFFCVLQAGCRLCAVPEVRPPSPRDQLSVRRTQSCQTVVLEQRKVYLFHRFDARGSTCGFRPTEGESEHRSTNTAWICWVCITNDGSQSEWIKSV